MSDDVQTSATIASLRAEVERLTDYAERLLAENVRLSNRQSMDREEIESMGKRNDELREEVSAIGTRLSMEQEDHVATRKALDTARERAGVLEAEVKAWRDWKEQCEVWPPEECTCEDKPRGHILATAMTETDRLNAIDAAKFGGA